MQATTGDNGGELTSDEELQRIRVGELMPHNAPITLVNYDPAWPQLFAHEADRIRAVLGEAALQVEHVGSTSVPGLIAKPIIDMLLVVPDSAHEPSDVPALKGAGYVLRVRERPSSGSWLGGRGGMCSTTPTPRPQQSTKSWTGLSANDPDSNRGRTCSPRNLLS